jgi:hypothetical protein
MPIEDMMIIRALQQAAAPVLVCQGQKSPLAAAPAELRRSVNGDRPCVGREGR